MKVFIILFITSFIFLSYQNFSYISEEPDNLDSELKSNLNIVIQDAKTLKINFTKIENLLALNQYKIDGSYKYPVRSKDGWMELTLQDMDIFYQCSNEPSDCSLTFKIPEKYPSMDLSKIYSLEPILRFSFSNKTQDEKSYYKVLLTKQMIQNSSSSL